MIPGIDAKSGLSGSANTLPSLSASGDLVWSPSAAQTGTWTLAVRATDSRDLTFYDDKSFTVQVKQNQAPVFATLPAFGNVTIPAIDPTTGLSTTLPAGNANIPATNPATGLPTGVSGPSDLASLLQYVQVGVPISFSLNATDANGDAISYFLGDNSPASAYIDENNVLHWTPEAGEIGNQTLSIYATDASQDLQDLLINPEALAALGFGDAHATTNAMGEGGVGGIEVPATVVGAPTAGDAWSQGHPYLIGYVGDLSHGPYAPAGDLLGYTGVKQLAGGDSNPNSGVVFSLTSSPDRVDVTLSPSGELDAKVFSDGSAPPAGAFNIDFTVANKYGLSAQGRAYLSIGPGGNPYVSFDPVARNYLLGGGMGETVYVTKTMAAEFDGNVNGLSKLIVVSGGTNGHAETLSDGSLRWVPNSDTFEGTDSFTYYVQAYVEAYGQIVLAGKGNIATVRIIEQAILQHVDRGNRQLVGTNAMQNLGMFEQWYLEAGGFPNTPAAIIQDYSMSIEVTLQRGGTQTVKAAYSEFVNTATSRRSDEIDTWRFFGLNFNTDIVAHATITIKGTLRAYELTPQLQTKLAGWNNLTRKHPFRNEDGDIDPSFGTITSGTWPSNDSAGAAADLAGEKLFKTENGDGVTQVFSWKPVAELQIDRKK
jgi:hypothetical protein